jgi:hypothetical protein
MHPRTPELLSQLIGAAESLIRNDAPRGTDEDFRNIERLYAEVTALRARPADGERFIDDATVWLAQALRNAEREGPLGEAKKWIEIARCMLPWVRADLALALARARPATTSQER